MPTVRRSRVLPARRDAVWALVSDVHAQPRWWPRVSRVEAVSPQGFTQVMQTKTGRPVRADFRFCGQEEPYVRAWEQQLEGTPFDRVLRAASTTIRVAEDGEGQTRVTLEQRQKLRGMSRLGGFMVRRATRQILDAALDGLDRALA